VAALLAAFAASSSKAASDMRSGSSPTDPEPLYDTHTYTRGSINAQNTHRHPNYSKLHVELLATTMCATVTL